MMSGPPDFPARAPASSALPAGVPVAATVHCGLLAQEGKVLKGVGGPQYAQEPESQAGSCAANQVSNHMWQLRGAGTAL